MYKISTIPNTITISRIISIPIMIFLLISNNVEIYKWVLLYALVSDIADGLLARMLKAETEFGAKLDSIADLLMYVCALFGIFIFKANFLKENWIIVSFVISLFFITRIINFILLKKPFNAYHSYLAKAMAYAQGIFIIFLFMFGFSPYIFFPAMAIGIISNLEEIIIMFILKKDKPNIKGLYWLKK